jgi:ataxia telangiectasia mutated family protein
MALKEFRESMRKIQGGDDPERNHKLIATFKENRKRFRPVMRNFFMERKKEPLSWFAMRLAYSRSLAVSNIVGYIVGIGDRHCSNILIDHSTGELVHIDFGVAFGQVSVG